MREYYIYTENDDECYETANLLMLWLDEQNSDGEVMKIHAPYRLLVEVEPRLVGQFEDFCGEQDLDWEDLDGGN